MIVDSRNLLRLLLQDFTLPESKDEKEAILFWVLEHELNLSRADVMRGQIVKVDTPHLQATIRRLNLHEPVQYILGEAEFYGRKFRVDRSVLIPRPETEILVKNVIDQFRVANKTSRLLDIGTGSGCIAITLALEVPRAEVVATDISVAALEIAQQNADRLNARVQLHSHNILQDSLSFEPFDVVVSNPPYILECEKAIMARNVTEYEPPQALFVPDTDPLVFHKAIAEKSIRALKSGGILITEINEQLGPETAVLFQSIGFLDTIVVQDLQGKDRLVIGKSNKP